MSEPQPREPGKPGVSGPLAVVMATISFFALTILGLGALSYATDRDIIAVPGLGPVPGAAAMFAAVIVFIVGLWLVVRREHPPYPPVALVAIATVVVHLVVVWIGAATVAELVTATVVVGDLLRGGTSIIVLFAALIAAWGGVALRRTRSSRPLWPWEQDDSDER